VLRYDETPVICVNAVCNRTNCTTGFFLIATRSIIKPTTNKTLPMLAMKRFLSVKLPDTINPAKKV
jgi:hypothetical protein